MMEKTPWWLPYFQNVVSEYIALAALVIFLWIVYRFLRRGPLLSFFGIRRSRKLFVYLSNLDVPQGGSRGMDGRPRSFASSAIPAYEATLVPKLQRQFNYVIPGVKELPGFLRYILFSDVEVEFRPSPLDESEFKGDSTFIAVGSPGYNLASSYVENSLSSIGRFGKDNNEIYMSDGPRHDGRYAFVQRAGRSKQKAFYLAGPAISGTTGAVLYLLENWRELDKRYPHGRPFCVILHILTEDGSKQKAISYSE